jgi:hypothetical protein
MRPVMFIGRSGEIGLAEGLTVGTGRTNDDERAGLERRDASLALKIFHFRVRCDHVERSSVFSVFSVYLPNAPRPGLTCTQENDDKFPLSVLI